MAKVNREDLLNALEVCVPGLADREFIDQGTCFAFENGEVFTYNDKTSCRCPSTLPNDFTGAVAADPIRNLLAKLQEEYVDVSIKGGELLVTGKNRQSGFRMEAEVRLPIHVVEKPTTWKKLPEDFCDAINMVQGCAGTDEKKFSLTCVHVTPHWVEASSEYQLCRWNLETNFEEEALLERKSVKHVGNLGSSEFSETKSWVHFKGPHGLVHSCKRYTDVTDFPDVGSGLVHQGQPITLPKGLDEAVDKAQVFTGETGETADDDYVSVELRPGKIRLRGQGSQGWHKEWKKIAYDGPPLSFFVSSSQLIDLVRKHPNCSVTDDYLIVDGGHYKFVTSLNKPEPTDGLGTGMSNGNGKKKRKHKGRNEDEEDE